MPDRPTPSHLFSIGARREEDKGSPRAKSPESETDSAPEARKVFASGAPHARIGRIPECNTAESGISPQEKFALAAQH